MQVATQSCKARIFRRSAADSADLEGALFFDPLPDLLDRQPTVEHPRVVPLVAFDSTLEFVRSAFDGLEGLSHSVFGRVGEIIALKRIASAAGAGNNAVCAVGKPHHLGGSNMLDGRHRGWQRVFFPAVLCRDELPGADQLALGLFVSESWTR